MKKYLMMGAVALLMGASFTSCSNDNDLYDPQANATKILQDYESAFINVFGTPAANQTWGFGEAAASRMTRANDGETVPQTEAYHNMNHNEWADPDKELGGYTVPAPLTDEQKAVVAAYFQSVPNLTYEDPHLRHFFVQQVYKGGNTTVRNTTEGITAANNSKYDSDNMNLLSVGQANIHINDFNAGNCSVSDVLDNGQHVGGTTHKDQITLMVNIDDTSCFGYHETGSSTQHNNKAALVSWQTIRDWANANSLNGNCLTDNWNRSFLGFDLAIKEGAQAYATDNDGNVLYADYSQAPESPKYAWDGENIIEIADPTKYYPVEYYDAYKTIKKNGESIGWLTTNTNFYVAAGKVTLDQTQSVNRAQASTLIGQDVRNCVVLKDIMVGDTYYQSVINLPKINQLVADGYLPVNNKSLQEWVKVGKSDGYFSDWIVTLTKAQRIPEPQNPSLRVIAEDLTAGEKGDFDFNDVVFDAEYIDANKVKVTIYAAGGTLPLTVAGNEVHALFKAANPDATTDQGGEINTMTMINTNARFVSLKVGSSSAELPNKPVFYITDQTWNSDANLFAADVRDKIKIIVTKTGVDGNEYPLELTADQGKTPGKVGVGTTYQWKNEREYIGDEFKKFVTDPGNTMWWQK